MEGRFQIQTIVLDPVLITATVKIFCPTFLRNQVLLGPTDVAVISVVGQIGALISGTTLGYVSAFFGRTLTMLIACICGGPWCQPIFGHGT